MLNNHTCILKVQFFVNTGRGRHSHAYTHSVQLYHHVFLNLSSLEFYCLPDNYQIIDSSLEDIKVCIVFINPSVVEGHSSLCVSVCLSVDTFLQNDTVEPLYCGHHQGCSKCPD